MVQKNRYSVLCIVLFLCAFNDAYSTLENDCEVGIENLWSCDVSQLHNIYLSRSMIRKICYVILSPHQESYPQPSEYEVQMLIRTISLSRLRDSLFNRVTAAEGHPGLDFRCCTGTVEVYTDKCGAARPQAHTVIEASVFFRGNYRSINLSN